MATRNTYCELSRKFSPTSIAECRALHASNPWKTAFLLRIFQLRRSARVCACSSPRVHMDRMRKSWMNVECGRRQLVSIGKAIGKHMMIFRACCCFRNNITNRAHEEEVFPTHPHNFPSFFLPFNISSSPYRPLLREKFLSFFRGKERKIHNFINYFFLAKSTTPSHYCKSMRKSCCFPCKIGRTNFCTF